MEFTAMEKALLLASIDTYTSELRKACSEDQGTPDGRPGTIGFTTQRDLRSLRNRINFEVMGY